MAVSSDQFLQNPFPKPSIKTLLSHFANLPLFCYLAAELNFPLNHQLIVYQVEFLQVLQNLLLPIALLIRYRAET